MRAYLRYLRSEALGDVFHLNKWLMIDQYVYTHTPFGPHLIVLRGPCGARDGYMSFPMLQSFEHMIQSFETRISYGEFAMIMVLVFSWASVIWKLSYDTTFKVDGMKVFHSPFQVCFIIFLFKVYVDFFHVWERIHWI